MPQQQWTTSFLDEMRTIGDPLGDSVIAKVFKEGDVDAVNDLLRKLVYNDGIVPDDLPDFVKVYLNETDNLPEWADLEMIKKGEQVFLRYLEIPLVFLACGSLPECYALKNGVQVLWLTQQLRDHVHRRILETAYMVIEVMTVGGLQNHGKGLRAIQKVRLMHAAVRHLIVTQATETLKASQPKSLSDVLLKTEWNPQFGYPINQEDLAFTMLSFSYVPLRGLKQMVTTLDKDEEEAYIYSWSVAGSLLGLKKEMIPNSFAEAEILYTTIKKRQQGVSLQGEKMSEALISFLQDQMIPWWAFPFKPLPRVITRTIVGNETADILKIKKSRWYEKLLLPGLVVLIRIIDWFEESLYKNHPKTQVVGDWISYKMLKKLSKLPRGGQRKLFEIPTHLATAWKLK